MLLSRYSVYVVGTPLFLYVFPLLLFLLAPRREKSEGERDYLNLVSEYDAGMNSSELCLHPRKRRGFQTFMKVVVLATAVLLYMARRCRALSTSPMTWWREELKSPRFVCAPMVDQSSLPFRELVRRHGCELCYTPMIHAGVAASSDKYVRTTFTTRPSDTPLVVQLAAHDPDLAEATADRVLDVAEKSGNADGVKCFDLNLGCPQKIARKGKYGAFLLENDLAAAVSVVERLSTRGRVSCKVRLLEGRSVDESIQSYTRLVDAGASMLCVHGRNKAMNKQFSGSANWDAIKAVKAAFPDIPVIANGGVATFSDVTQLLQHVDAVMSSEMLLDNPALFSQATDTDQPDQRDLTFEYLDLVEECDGNLSEARAHMFKLLHGSLEQFPELRPKLAVECKSLSDYREFVRDLDRRDPDRIYDARHASPDFVHARSWYFRHRTYKERSARRQSSPNETDRVQQKAKRARSSSPQLELKKQPAAAAASSQN